MSAALAGALYLPALAAGFVWDDHWLIEANPAIHGAGLLPALFSDFWAPTGSASGYWRPLVVVSYALDGAVSGWSAAWFHAVNLLAHAGTSAAVAALALGLGAGTAGALAAGAWFATAPAHVESVAWVAGRTDVVCALLFLLALALDRRERAARKPGPGAAPLALFALALLAKETALVLLPLIAVAEAGGLGREGRRGSLRWLAPYAAVTAVWIAVHLLVTAHRPGTAELDAIGRARGRLAALTMFPRYLPLLWPWVTHTPAAAVRLPSQLHSPEVMGAAIVHVAFVALVAWLIRRRARVATPLALLWLALLPPAAAAFTRGTVLFAERFLYLPSAGVALALGLAVGAATGAGRVRAWLAGSAALALVAGGAIETLRLLPRWRDDAVLFEYMATSEPRNAPARTNWAQLLANQGREAEALEQLAIAEQLHPRMPEVYFGRALVHYGRGRWLEAARSADSAIALDSTRIEPRVTRALALMRAGRSDDAEPELERLMQRVPGNPMVESAWGQGLLARGRPADALPYLERAARLVPRDPDLFYGLGRAYASVGRVPEARDAFARAVAADSTLYEGWLDLATACHLVGDLAGRDRALVQASALPGAADGRVEATRRRLLGPGP